MRVGGVSLGGLATSTPEGTSATGVARGPEQTPADAGWPGDPRALSASRFLCRCRAALLAVVAHHDGTPDTGAVAELRPSNSRRSQASLWGLTSLLREQLVTQLLPQMNSCCRRVNSCKRAALPAAGTGTHVYSHQGRLAKTEEGS